jgi:hypothetical protein
MSLKIAVLSSLTALSAFRAPAPADDQAQSLGPVGPEPVPTQVSRSSSAAESKKQGAEGAAWRRLQNR